MCFRVKPWERGEEGGGKRSRTGQGADLTCDPDDGDLMGSSGAGTFHQSCPDLRQWAHPQGINQFLDLGCPGSVTGRGVDSNCQRGLWVRVSVANSSWAWRNCSVLNASVLTEGTEHTLLFAMLHAKSRLFFLSHASYPTMFTCMASDGLDSLVQEMMLQQTSLLIRWIQDVSLGIVKWSLMVLGAYYSHLWCTGVFGLHQLEVI